MKTICLRFNDAFAPEKGTIQLHKDVIKKYGFVWYGKQGCRVSRDILEELLANGPAEIILIKSGTSEKFWATVTEYSYDEQDEHPRYYDTSVLFIKTWFKITKIESAPVDVLKKCYLFSSNKPLNDVIKKTMNGFFVINYEEKQ